MHFHSKQIIITGASSGIGEAVVSELSAFDCSIHIIARRIDYLNDLKKKLSGNPAKIQTYQCDVSNREQILHTVAAIYEQTDRVDLAILNAGVGIYNDFTSFSADNAETMISVNVLGMLYCIEALAPRFIQQRSGIIAGVSSLADSRGFARSGVYCASKAAATLVLESAAVELLQYNIKVITIRPGFVKTPMTDKNKFKMPFLMPAEKAAKIILRGLQKEKRYIAFPLILKLIVDIGRLVPNSLFEFFSRKQYQSLNKNAVK